jgi:signal peptidase I
MALQDKDLKTLMSNLYTSRFVVKNGAARNYNHQEVSLANQAVSLEGVPDGTYEFYYGKAYEVLLGGITRQLPPDHPIYTASPERIKTWYNQGIRWDVSFEPGQGHWPARYLYFREGSLYAMGKPLFNKEDKTLQEWVKSEKQKQAASKGSDPYIAFLDQGPPEGKAFFEAFSLHVPDKKYLVLGDNHAMSADSRIFGFVPEQNLQGVPEIILWPIGNRLGKPEQKPYPTFVAPRLIIWSLAAVIGLACYTVYRYRLRKRIDL